MAGSFIKGALIEFVPTFLMPTPNVINFSVRSLARRLGRSMKHNNPISTNMSDRPHRDQ